MALSRRSLIALLVFICVTAGLKVSLLRSGDSGAAKQFLAGDEVAVAAKLRTSGFEVRVPAPEKVPALIAGKGPCHLIVVIAQPAGYDRALVRQLGRDADAKFFVYRGGFYADQPAWRTWMDDLILRDLRQVGIRAAHYPILGVAARGCNVRQLPWTDIAQPIAASE